MHCTYLVENFLSGENLVAGNLRRPEESRNTILEAASNSPYPRPGGSCRPQHRRMVDAEDLADLPGALAGFQPAPGFLALNLGELGLASKLHATCLCSRQAAPTAGKNAQAL